MKAIDLKKVVSGKKSNENAEFQRALNAHGAKLLVDGQYGPKTRLAAAAFQKKQGFIGKGADGLPGPLTFKLLGLSQIKQPSVPAKAVTAAKAVIAKVTGANYEKQAEPAANYTRVWHRGALVNIRTRTLLSRAEEIYGKPFAITQGSYSKGVSASAGTHDGGGALDLSISGMDAYKMQLALRKAGFAAWVRTPAQGFSYHIHALAIGDRDMAWLARSQVKSYFIKRDGLARNGSDNTEHRWPTWVDRYRGK